MAILQGAAYWASVTTPNTTFEPVNGPNGMVRPAPRLVDANKNSLDARIGNGSSVKVQYKEWQSEYKGKTFYGLDFQAMQVIDLIEVGSPDGSEFDAMGDGMEDEL